ncbi:MAG TPA: hypothetical protein VFH29_05820 [Anaerolineales bacterium]|nr:hypothetical protein [Anaerolineales bacterium]
MLAGKIVGNQTASCFKLTMRRNRPLSPVYSWIAACALLAACTTAPEQISPTLAGAPPTTTEVPTREILKPTGTPEAVPSPAAIIPVATSRGPNLEATDPETVRLDAGGLQLVEFFRFT